jgi:acyl carrier protein
MTAVNKEDTRSRVVTIIAQKLSRDKTEIKDNATLQELGADSLDLVEIIMRLEEEFNIEINDDDAARLCNVGQVIEYVHQLRTK